jgi:uncharacterized HAD superfamily protein
MKKEWNRQLEFNKKFFKKIREKDFDKLTPEEKIAETKDYLIHILRELGEVLNATPGWKMHRKESKNFPQYTEKMITEELIDAQKFLWGLIQLWGISYEEFIREFNRKTDVVEQRFFQEHEIGSLKLKNIAAIDIDGVLCDYDEGMIRYIQRVEKFKFKVRSLELIKTEMGSIRWEEMKHRFRSSGYKTKMPVYEDARRFLFRLKKAGYFIALISARPFQQYTRIYSDTVEWLKKNRLPYDLLFFDELKHLKITKVIPNIKFMVEDRKEYVDEIAKLGYKVYFLERKSWDPFEDYTNIISVKELDKILKHEKIN